jgi:hypothetical protein
MEIAPILTTQEWIAGYYAKRDFHFYGATSVERIIPSE